MNALDGNKKAMSLIRMLDNINNSASLMDANGDIIFANSHLLASLEELENALVGSNVYDLADANKINFCLFPKPYRHGTK